MFGQIRERRKEKRRTKERQANADFKRAQQVGDQNNGVQEYQKHHEEGVKAAQPGLDDLKNKRAEQLQESVNEVSTRVPGLDPQQRQQLQETASNAINKDYQNYSRQLASSAGARGVRGGSAAAQQMALQGQALDTRRQFERDIGERSIDLEMQRLAGALASLEGKQAQTLGAQSEARDFIEAQKEKKRQNALANVYNKQYLAR